MVDNNIVEKVRQLFQSVDKEVSTDPLGDCGVLAKKLMELTNLDSVFLHVEYPFIRSKKEVVVELSGCNTTGEGLGLAMKLTQATINDAEEFPYFVSQMGVNTEKQRIFVKILQVKNEEEKNALEQHLTTI